LYTNISFTYLYTQDLELKAHEFLELMEELLPYCHIETSTRKILKRCLRTSCCTFFMHPAQGRFMGDCRVSLQGYFRSEAHNFVMLLLTILNTWILMV
jgi:hypothetical protein